METITYVTCFYDLKNRDKINRRSKEEYMEYAKLIFAIKKPMIIYTELEYFWEIYNGRKKYNNQHNTLIIIKRFEDLPYYKFKNLLDYFKNVKHNEIFLKNEKDTPNYFIITWSKFFFLREIILNNPFNTTHVGWIDFGINHLNISGHTPEAAGSHDIENFIIPDKIKVGIITGFGQTEINSDTFYTSFKGVVLGGLFIGKNDNVLILTDLFNNEIYTFLSKELSPFEESIMAKIIITHMDLFTFYFGDYKNIIKNFNYPTENIDHIINIIIIRSRMINSHIIGLIACKLLYDSWKLNKVLLSIKQIHALLDEYMIFSYYNNNHCDDIILEYITYYNTNIEFKNIAKSHIDRVKINLKFLNFDYSLKLIDS